MVAETVALVQITNVEKRSDLSPRTSTVETETSSTAIDRAQIRPASLKTELRTSGASAVSCLVARNVAPKLTSSAKVSTAQEITTDSAQGIPTVKLKTGPATSSRNAVVEMAEETATNLLFLILTNGMKDARAR